MKCLIIIPAFNEAGSIEIVVDNIIANYPKYDYVVINDCSKDQTAAICERKNYNVIHLPINIGIGGAVQTGYKYAREKGYDIAVQLDGDGQHDVSFVKDMISLIQEKQADIVIGSRYLNREGFQSSKLRRVGIRLLAWLIQLCTSTRIEDVTSGFRAINKRFIQIYAENYPSDYPEPEAVVQAFMYGGKVREVPVIMRARESGTSSIGFIKSIYYMIKVAIAIVICRIGFGIRREKQ